MRMQAECQSTNRWLQLHNIILSLTNVFLEVSEESLLLLLLRYIWQSDISKSSLITHDHTS